jgi:hypothetical protein
MASFKIQGLALLGMCYIICTSSSIGRTGGFKGGGHGAGGRNPLTRALRGNDPEEKKIPRETFRVFGWFFGTWFLPMVFYFRLRN